MTETRRIADIVIDHCYRHDLGDLQGLAKSIREFGLLRPVLIKPLESESDAELESPLDQPAGEIPF